MQQRWCSMSQHFTSSKTKTVFIQHVRILQLWYNVASKAIWDNFVARQKLVACLVFVLVARHHLNQNHVLHHIANINRTVTFQCIIFMS